MNEPQPPASPPPTPPAAPPASPPPATPAAPAAEAPPQTLFAQRLMGGSTTQPAPAPAPAAAPATPATPAATTPAAPAAPAAATPATPPAVPKDKKVKVAKGYENLIDQKTAEQIATAAATAAVKASTAQPSTKVEVQFSDEDMKELQMIAVLEDEGVKPKGYTDKIAGVMREIQSKQIKPGSPEEDAVWEAAGVDVSEDDIAEAQRLSRINSLRKENEELRHGLHDVRQDMIEIKTQPIAIKAATAAAAEVLEGIAPDAKEVAAKLFRPDGAINSDVAKELEARPDGEILLKSTVMIRDFAEAATMIFNGAVRKVEKDKRLSEVGKDVINYAIGLEKEIQSNEALRTAIEEAIGADGRAFMPRPKWAKLSEAEQAKYWTTTPELVVHFAKDEIVRRGAEATKKVVEENTKRQQSLRSEIEAEILKKYGIDPSKQQPQPAAPAAAPQPPPPRMPTFPSAVDPVPAPRSNDASTPGGVFGSRLLSGSRI